jgi:hypothetical protein
MERHSKLKSAFYFTRPEMRRFYFSKQENRKVIGAAQRKRNAKNLEFSMKSPLPRKTSCAFGTPIAKLSVLPI